MPLHGYRPIGGGSCSDRAGKRRLLVAGKAMVGSQSGSLPIYIPTAVKPPVLGTVELPSLLLPWAQLLRS